MNIQQNVVVNTIVFGSFMFFIFSCGMVSSGSNANQPTSNEEHHIERAGYHINPSRLPNDVFVGVALSGGGSRAANFGAAALQELESLGFLQHAVAFSSVSGGSIPSAYFGLFRQEQDWSWNLLRDKLRKDFLWSWIGRWFLPQNFLRYWLTDFDRSDIMATVFNDHLFRGKTFDSLGKPGPLRPNIFLNATDFSLQRFVFDDQTFEKHGTRLDTFPMAQAVMASGAFPAVFNSVTIRDYRTRYAKYVGTDPPGIYLHLFDGGPADNLGITTLQDVAGRVNQELIDQGRKMSCFLFVIDAYQGQRLPTKVLESDPRSTIDYLVDRNALDAIDALLQGQRVAFLQQMGLLTESASGIRNLQGYIPSYRFKSHKREIECAVWHLTFDRLWYLANGNSSRETKTVYRNVWGLVKNTSTNYHLSGLNCTPDALQDALYNAATILVRNDRENRKGSSRQRILDKACSWFNAHGLEVHACKGVPQAIIEKTTGCMVSRWYSMRWSCRYPVRNDGRLLKSLKFILRVFKSVT